MRRAIALTGFLASLCSNAPLAAQSHQVVRVSRPEERNPVEVAVAINPTNPDHIVAVAHQGASVLSPRSSNVCYVSTNGGKKWRTVAAPNPDQRVQGDDAIAFGPDGVAHRTYIAFDGLRNPKATRARTGIFTSASRDRLLWSEPVAIVDHVNTLEPFEDKPWLAADTTESPHKGNICVAWTRFDVY